MTLNIIPVQGTFDIARGRNLLRTHIAAHRWSPCEGARAGALLTALGELIMSAQSSCAIPVEVAIVSGPPQQELWMRCTVALANLPLEMLASLEDRIHRAADRVQVTYQPHHICVTAHLYPDPMGEV